MKTVWTAAARNSGFWRFVSAGAGDALRRLARLTARQSVDEGDETAVVRVFERSAVVNAVGVVLDRLSAAARGSAIVKTTAGRWHAWRAQPPATRTRHSGIALVTAAGVYVILSLWQGPVAGWLWLVPPVLAAAFGLRMALAPARGLSAGERC